MLLIGHSVSNRIDAHPAAFWPNSDRFLTAAFESTFSLLRQFQRIIDFDTEVTHCTLKLGMPQQQLNRS
jgi:hypothetical protein